jgi:hypothetical protein
LANWTGLKLQHDVQHSNALELEDKEKDEEIRQLIWDHNCPLSAVIGSYEIHLLKMVDLKQAFLIKRVAGTRRGYLRVVVDSSRLEPQSVEALHTGSASRVESAIFYSRKRVKKAAVQVLR